MKKTHIGAISLFAVIILIAFGCVVYADTGVPAVPEIQGLSTGTGINAQGTVTETDAGAWTLTNDPSVFYILTGGELQMTSLMVQQLQASGGSMSGNTLIIPSTILNQGVAGETGTWAHQIALYLQSPGAAETISGGGIHNGILDPGQVQYTAGYNDQYSGVSGQQTFTKSMALSNANKIADQSNIKADTNIQYIALDTGRATRSEDLLLDGAAQAQDSAGLILCPFANANPGIIPAFCNIEQAGSAFDTTLTSTVTSADTRFVGTDATIPVVLNYNINAEGLTAGNQSSPMIGSVSAYLKVHVQESRNESTISILQPPDDIGPQLISFPDTVHPTKSEDLVYSETSSASGLISKFSKSMSYSSQATSVKAPTTPVPNFPG